MLHCHVLSEPLDAIRTLVPINSRRIVKNDNGQSIAFRLLALILNIAAIIDAVTMGASAGPAVITRTQLTAAASEILGLLSHNEHKTF